MTASVFMKRSCVMQHQAAGAPVLKASCNLMDGKDASQSGNAMPPGCAAQPLTLRWHMVYDEALREAEADGVPIAGPGNSEQLHSLVKSKSESTAAMYMEKGVPSLLVRLQMGGTTLLCRKKVARVPARQPLRTICRFGVLASAWVCPVYRIGLSAAQSSPWQTSTNARKAVSVSCISACQNLGGILQDTTKLPLLGDKTWVSTGRM